MLEFFRRDYEINKPVAATANRVVVLRRLPSIPVPHLVLTELSQKVQKSKKDASGMCVEIVVAQATGTQESERSVDSYRTGLVHIR